MAFFSPYAFPLLAPSAFDEAWFPQLHGEDELLRMEEAYEDELRNIGEKSALTRPIGAEGRTEDDDDETRDDEEEEEEEEAFDYPRYLFAFYKRYNPEAIERIDAILKQYSGNYDAMLIRLFEKYDLSLEGLPTESARNLAFQDDSD
uniref:Uncharacterized protein n=1 Tax=Octactis speculum TaxID=3111310 RepID=A0A7S2DUR7_9STRA|mmetsp:Transcript_54512/g.74510  ORF Transcript_54512/g.74510 Transcript_54512/m.74510 type:complete len:147 (+) Transcript_54512:39-479(+)